MNDSYEFEAAAASRLFQPLRLRGFTAPNRVMVSPMQQYSGADGLAGDHHLVQLGRFAMGGAGMVIAEATAIASARRSPRRWWRRSA